MLEINGFRSVGTVIVSAGAILSCAAAWAQPLALNDPYPRFPASIFQQVMPEESTVAEPAEAADRVPAHLRRQVVSYSGREGAGTIVIDTPNTYLYYVLGNGKAMRYGIGVGREGFTWSGVQSITRKTEWPDWVPPSEMLQRQPYLPRFMAGGPGNPLGARAMYLGNTIYRIHGTNAPSTIGGRVSSGCIRMLNEDVTDLYSRVTLGTKVVVMPMGARNVPMAETPRERQAPARVSINTVRGVY
jgi:lipoprotein-anchoring transpeptidase ErfK/SrfK